MEIEIGFPGGKRVDATYRGFVIRTDQPESAGGEGSAPTPFDLFLASLGTCTGYYVLAFCQKRQIPTEGVSLTLRAVRDEAAHRISRVEVRVRLPHAFPEEYVAACVRAAERCAVKAHLESPPAVSIQAERT
ncbi:MAG: OsmC family protein [Candidatus Bipolaricaulis sp.]|nr:OsmC family protein [Candidatus Bipolaricaulis sp.]MDD5220295.1 OsmC family protein [Candidatus Bipolaricaulis sp.]